MAKVELSPSEQTDSLQYQRSGIFLLVKDLIADPTPTSPEPMKASDAFSRLLSYCPPVKTAISPRELTGFTDGKDCRAIAALPDLPGLVKVLEAAVSARARFGEGEPCPVKPFTSRLLVYPYRIDLRLPLFRRSS